MVADAGPAAARAAGRGPHGRVAGGDQRLPARGGPDARRGLGRAGHGTPAALSQGRTQQLWRVDITDESGRLIAHDEIHLQNVAGT